MEPKGELDLTIVTIKNKINLPGILKSFFESKVKKIIELGRISAMIDSFNCTGVLTR